MSCRVLIIFLTCIFCYLRAVVVGLSLFCSFLSRLLLFRVSFARDRIVSYSYDLLFFRLGSFHLTSVSLFDTPSPDADRP